jgi:hypothetical protein
MSTHKKNLRRSKAATLATLSTESTDWVDDCHMCFSPSMQLFVQSSLRCSSRGSLLLLPFSSLTPLLDVTRTLCDLLFTCATTLAVLLYPFCS